MKRPKELDGEVAVVGLKASGKTSFLAALSMRPFARMSNGAEWAAVADDPGTRQYLMDAWSAIRDGRPVQPTLPGSKHPVLSLVLRRNVRDNATHVLRLKCIDSSGEFVGRASREGPEWRAIVDRVAAASVVLLAIDSMLLLHAARGDRRGEALVDGLVDMLRDAGLATTNASVPLDRKLLAVCFCKCDAVDVVEIDGINDEADALVLRNHLVSPKTQALLSRSFPLGVGYFGVSVLRDRWRWGMNGALTGACVRVGDDEISPVGLFEPFEWLSQRLS